MTISWFKKFFSLKEHESGYWLKALSVTMISMSGVSIGIGAFVLLVDTRFDNAVKTVEHSALESYEQKTEQVLNDPALTLQYRQVLLNVKLLPRSFKERVRLIGPDDLALKDEVKLVRVKGQKKRLSQDVSLVRFIAEKENAVKP